MLLIKEMKKIKNDCFAYAGGKDFKKSCVALKECLCIKGKCPFYKPKKYNGILLKK